MEQTSFSISDVSRMVDVKPGKLRRWEEELEISIPRNEMGHRIYRQDEIDKIQNIKWMQNDGFQIKAIKLLLPNVDKIKQLPVELRNRLCQEVNKRVEPTGVIVERTVTLPETSKNVEEPVEMDKLEQFSKGICQMIQHTIDENKEQLTKEITKEVSTAIVKELNYQFRQQEEQAEAHFRKIDEALRGKQKKRRRSRTKFV